MGRDALRFATRDSWVEIEIAGDATRDLVPEFVAHLEALIERGVVVAVLDLRQTTLLDAAFTRAIYDARQRLNDGGGGIVLLAAHPRVRKVLELVKRLQPIAVVTSLEEARSLARLAAAKDDPT